MGTVEENINYFRSIDYPEYSDKATSTKELIVKKNGSKDFGLLDLSLSQKDRIDKKIIQIVSSDLLNIGKYSYSQNKTLITQLSRVNHVPKTHIAITSGCDGALRIISQLLISKGTKVCIPIPSFGRYEYHSKINKGKVYFFTNETFPYDTDIKNLIEFLKAKQIEVLFLANPNNPTGIYKSKKQIKQILDNFSGYTVIDESLINPNTVSLSSFVKRYPRLIVVKSFSKFYGLAGARIGYLIASNELINPIKKLISPFEVNSLALSIAIAVLKDKSHTETEAKLIREQINKLKKLSDRNNNINVTPTESSLALIRYSGNQSIYDLLLERGIKTVDGRDFRGLESENTVRVSIKDADSINYLIAEINKL